MAMSQPAQPRITREIVEALRQERRACTNPVAEKFMADLVPWADAARASGARAFATDAVAWCATHKDERLVCLRCENKRRASGPASERKAEAVRANARKPRPNARKGWPDLLVKLHRDGTVSYWSVTRKKWREKRLTIGQTDLRLLPPAERSRIAKHLDIPLPTEQASDQGPDSRA